MKRRDFLKLPLGVTALLSGASLAQKSNAPPDLKIGSVEGARWIFHCDAINKAKCIRVIRMNAGELVIL